jgi:DNA repair photolyase
MLTGIWDKTPIGITENHFEHKSLSFWSANIAVGCGHGCPFCYVTSTFTQPLIRLLEDRDVADPGKQWGAYLFLRRWNEAHFLKSLIKAELTKIPPGHDGNRAVMFCTTTDPYPVAAGAVKECEAARSLLRYALELILERSTLRVRIQTRSPLAVRDFGLFKSFGDRLTFGMSIPTLNTKLSRTYEPYAPAVTARLYALNKAKEAGLNVYVAMAPTYSECDENDLRRTLQAFKELDLVTIFHEPINVRDYNIQRIADHAAMAKTAIVPNVAAFDTPETTMRYGLNQLFSVQRVATELGIAHKLKLWPDKSLASKSAFMKIRHEEFAKKYPRVQLTPTQRDWVKTADEKAYAQHLAWIHGWWAKISQWPGVQPQEGWTIPALSAESPFTITLPEDFK